MSKIIPVDLTKTGGKLLLPGAPVVAAPPPAARPQFVPPNVTPPGAPAPAPPQPAGEAAKASEPPKYKYPDPANADVQAFVQAVVSGRRFTRTEVLFGGAVSVTFRGLSAAEEDAIRVRAVGDMRAAGGLSAVNALELQEKRTAWGFGAAVESLRIGDALYTGGPLVASGGVNYDDYHQRMQAHCAYDPVYVAVRAAYIRFSNLLGGLEERAADPNFFAATGSGG